MYVSTELTYNLLLPFHECLWNPDLLPESVRSKYMYVFHWSVHSNISATSSNSDTGGISIILRTNVGTLFQAVLNVKTLTRKCIKVDRL